MKSQPDILRRLIRELPEYNVPEEVWVNISEILDKDYENDNLKRSISQLKPLTAPDQWPGIEKELRKDESDKVLAKAVAELPQYLFKKDLFESIHQKIKPRTAFARYWKIAAMIIFTVMGAYLVWEFQKQSIEVIQTEELLYSSETVLELLATLPDEDEVLRFIESNCIEFVVKCDAPIFQGLLSHYQDLRQAEMVLLKEIHQNQHTPQLVKYLVRIRKQRNEVGKSMIDYLQG